LTTWLDRICSGASAAAAASRARGLLGRRIWSSSVRFREFPPSFVGSYSFWVQSQRFSVKFHSNRCILLFVDFPCPSVDAITLADEDTVLIGWKKLAWISVDIKNGCWIFCKSCSADVSSGRTPKFSALNSVNVVMSWLSGSFGWSDLGFKECVIARRHPIGSILSWDLVIGEAHLITMPCVSIWKDLRAFRPQIGLRRNARKTTWMRHHARSNHNRIRGDR